MRLGRKQSSRHEDWLAQIEAIESIVSLDQLEQLAEETVSEITSVVGRGRAAYGWSGGKDSMVLQEICRRARIKECVLVICNLEYPAFLGWATDHMPDDLEIVNTGQDLDWLVAHPEMLFPKTAEAAGNWFSGVQHTGQRRYARKHNLDALLLGRRRADGNFVGKNGSNRYTDSHGTTRYSPMAHWTHEDLLAGIHYWSLPLPPCYGWPRGYRVGTGAWPARQWTDSDEHGWSEVYQIDRSIVRDAGPRFASGRAFLASIGG